MHKTIGTFSRLALSMAILWLAVPNVYSKEQDVIRQRVSAHALPNVPGHMLTAVTIELGPSVNVPAHRHEAFVLAYVLEGTVLSQLGDAEPVEYRAGESWVEPLGVVHSLTQNSSDTDSAKILAVFVAKDGAELTTSGALPSVHP